MCVWQDEPAEFCQSPQPWEFDPMESNNGSVPNPPDTYFPQVNDAAHLPTEYGFFDRHAEGFALHSENLQTNRGYTWSGHQDDTRMLYDSQFNGHRSMSYPTMNNIDIAIGLGPGAGVDDDCRMTPPWSGVACRMPPVGEPPCGNPCCCWNPIGDQLDAEPGCPCCPYAKFDACCC